MSRYESKEILSHSTDTGYFDVSKPISSVRVWNSVFLVGSFIFVSVFTSLTKTPEFN